MSSAYAKTKAIDSMTLREILKPTPLCLADGRLNPDAVGFTRRPLHIPNLRGWGRKKRWEYWGLVSETHLVGLTIASLDYAGLLHIYVLDRRDGSHFSEERVLPFGLGVRLDDTLEPGRAEALGRLKMAFIEEEIAREANGRRQTRIVAEGKRIQVDAVATSRGEALGVVVPWSDVRFQYTLKDVARTLEGTVRIDEEEITLQGDSCFAVLDRGRGKWPRQIVWNWAAGFGVIGGRSIGLQLGGKWTDETGSTENAIFVDGKLHHLSEAMRWEYQRSDPKGTWRIRSEHIDAALTPFHLRHEKTDLWLIRSETHQAFGTWKGVARLEEGEEISLDGLIGWAEEASHLW